MAFTALATKAYKDPLTVQWMNSIKADFDIINTGVPKGFIIFDGSAVTTAKQSFNISNITDDAVGQYTLTYSVDFTTNVYTLIGGGPDDTTAANNYPSVHEAGTGGATCGTVQINVVNEAGGTPSDFNEVHVLIGGTRSGARKVLTSTHIIHV